MPDRETIESWRESKRERYERGYLPEEKRWIKLGADGVLYYDLRSLLSIAACPLYALSNENLAFALHRPYYGLSEGSPQFFSLFYECPPSETEQVVWVNTRRVHFFDSHELAEYMGPSFIRLVYDLVGSFVNGMSMFNATPKRYWPIVHEFAEAESVGARNGIPMLKSVEETTFAKAVRVCLDRMERQWAAGLEWSFFQVEEPMPFALAFSVIDHPGPKAHFVAVSILGMSCSEFMAVLDSVRPLSLEDEAVLRRTEEGFNQAQRRIYEEVVQDFET